MIKGDLKGFKIRVSPVGFFASGGVRGVRDPALETLKPSQLWEFTNVYLFFFEANELPAELTKNERILRLLRSKEGHRKS